jgi:YVTN family beta-propeller protein
VPITTATNTPGKPIKVGREPGVSVISPNGKTLYVTNGASASVTPISTATNTPGKAIKVGGAPGAIAITSNGRMLYVANQVPAR